MTASTRLPSTSAIADVQALRGGAGWLTPPLQPVAPATQPVAGRAVTVQIEHRAQGPDFSPMYEVLSTDHSGAVLVIAGATAIPGAIWGEILSVAATGAGFVGVALDGTARDVSTLQDGPLSVYATNTAIAGPQGTAHVAAVGVPVTIGGVQINDGDLVVIDDGGCVCVPAADADSVVADALGYEDAEGEVLRALAAGEPLTSAYRHKSAFVARLRR